MNEEAKQPWETTPLSVLDQLFDGRPVIAYLIRKACVDYAGQTAALISLEKDRARSDLARFQTSLVDLADFLNIPEPEKLNSSFVAEKAKSAILAERNNLCNTLIHSAKVEAELTKLRGLLDLAHKLIVRHHDCNVHQTPGGFCPVCHHKDGTEPEMDAILEALGNFTSKEKP